MEDFYAECVEEARRGLGSRCSMAVVLNDLGKERPALERALADPSVTSTAVSRVLARRGSKVAAQTVQRHRKGECSCPTT